MRVLLLASAALLLGGCGGHGRAAGACRLSRAAGPSERTGEHTLVLRLSGCGLRAVPHVELDGADGAPLGFAYVPEGGAPGHVVTLDKYRCDVRAADHARRVRLVLRDGTQVALGLGRDSILDFCPAEAPSSILHVYLGGVRPAATWREAFGDAYDGRLDRVWPCGALRAALTHLPPAGPMHSALPGVLRRAAARACDTALDGLRPGAPRAAFTEALGSPDLSRPPCTVWRWAPADGSLDGVRVCFRTGRAVTVQTAVHG